MELYRKVIQELPHNVGVLVPIPVMSDKYEEFENPTELSVNKEWKLCTVQQACQQLRQRSMTELLFCMLRSGH